jgi:hypothetical protein
MSRFKILVFILVIGIAGSILASAYWYYTRVLGHDNTVAGQIEQLKGKKNAPPDPGIKRFDKAIEEVKTGDLNTGREALYDLVRHFPESRRSPEAKRIIGEMNMDMLFSTENPLRRKYIVQPGDSMGLIARKNQTTIECLLRANGMLSTGLQPGDNVYVFNLEFDIVVDLSAKTLTLLRNDRFFKEYQAIDIKLPIGLKAPTELTLNDKAAWVQGRRVLSTDPQFMNADKWLMANKPGFNIRSQPQAKAVTPAQTVMPAAASAKTKGKQKPTSMADAVASADNDTVDGTAGIPETGVFLPREDTEELFTIMRTGTKLKVVR